MAVFAAFGFSDVNEAAQEINLTPSGRNNLAEPSRIIV
jgi:hypothetical protein